MADETPRPDDELEAAGGPPSEDFPGLESESDALPRRGASAEFVVDANAGAEAAMREAMDPANQSLADALRLSYRVLQLVIAVLVVLFLFSGFQTIQEGYTGVKTLFGRIQGDVGQEQLAPGPTLFWPYPVGEIVTVQVRRPVDVTGAFWPTFRRDDMTLEQATDRADVSQPIRPGTEGRGDGSLLTADGDLAHVQIIAEYTVDDAVEFLENVNPAVADRIIVMAMQRGMVHTAASFTLAELVELREEPAVMLEESAQQILDEMKSGIRLTDVQISQRTAPLAIRKTYSQVQSAREEAKTAIEVARQEAEKVLNGVAGPGYEGLSLLISEYEQALALNEDERSERIMGELGELLAGPEVAGEAKRIVSRAQAYQAEVDSTLGNDAQRFASLLPAYRENPDLLVRTLWLQAYADVIDNPMAEVFSMPWNLGGIGIAIDSSAQLMQERRRGEVDRRQREAAGMNVMQGPYLLRGRDQTFGQAGRRLNRSAETGFGRDR